MIMESSKTAPVVAFAFLGLCLMACTVSPGSEGPFEETGEAVSALDYLVQTDGGTTPPTGNANDLVVTASATRRLVRLASPGCTRVAGQGGQWNGSPVMNGSVASTSFCSYVWSSPSDASPDFASLSAIAMVDEQRAKPYEVPDPRVGNPPAPETSLSTPYMAMSPSHELGLTGNNKMRRSSGCGVCVTLEGNHLWMVLPPEATWGAPITLHSGSVSYGLGPITSPVTYAPAPAGLSGALSLSW
jgi:hypothetical protein